MEDTNQTTRHPLRLKDNRFGDPTKRGNGKDISSLASELKETLSRYGGMKLDNWGELGVTVFSGSAPRGEAKDDGSHDLSFFTIGVETSRTWINTHNCMGVVQLRDEESGRSVQIEIGSRFDEDPKKQFFLTYLLSKVFRGSFVGLVDLGRDSLWDLLLAFLFRRRLLEAGAVGLFRQYRTLNHNDARIRGRIDVDRHLRRNIPFCGKVAYATHEITFDNPTNRLIRHALAKMRRKWRGLLNGDNGLTDVWHQLEQNTPTWQPGDVMGCIKENQTRIRHPYFHAAYEPLRQVSLAILRDEGASLYQQQQEAEGVIFDGSWLWEEYLWTLLKRLPGYEHSENKEEVGGWQTPPGVTFYPDFFHHNARVILDAKYKDDGVNQEDAKQVFAYMFLMDAVHGGLIKPAGDEDRDPIPIHRQVDKAKMEATKALWHNFVLKPPSDASTAEDFLNKMGDKEKKFMEAVQAKAIFESGRRLGLTAR